MSVRWPLVTRALVEHRAIVAPLAIVLLANVLVYAFFVYPLERRVGTVTERTRAAEAELAAARTLHDQATGTLTGKDRAAEELEHFYREVLPASQSDARRLTDPRLDQLARRSGLRPLGMTAAHESDPDDTLARRNIQARIAGSYADIRRFIHQLEQAPEFLVIDRIVLAENTTEEGLLTIEMALSTYYREGMP